MPDYFKVSIVLIWIICSILSYGFEFAYVQKEYNITAEFHYWEDVTFSLFISIFGPVSLFIVFITRDFKHGLKFW